MCMDTYRSLNCTTHYYVLCILNELLNLDSIILSLYLYLCPVCFIDVELQLEIITSP